MNSKLSTVLSPSQKRWRSNPSSGGSLSRAKVRVLPVAYPHHFLRTRLNSLRRSCCTGPSNLSKLLGLLGDMLREHSVQTLSGQRQLTSKRSTTCAARQARPCSFCSLQVTTPWKECSGWQTRDSKPDYRCRCHSGRDSQLGREALLLRLGSTVAGSCFRTAT